MEKYFNITTSKGRFITGFFVVILFSLFIYYSTFYFEYDPSFWPVIYTCLFLIGIGIIFKITCYGWLAWIWDSLILVLSVSLSYTSINIIMNKAESYMSNVSLFQFEESIISILICLFIYLFILTLIARPRLSFTLSGLFLFFWGLIGYAIYTFRGDLFLFPDIFSLSTALDVANNYSLKVTPELIISSLLTITILVFSLNARRKLKIKSNIFLRFISLFLCTCMIFSFWTTDVEWQYYFWVSHKNEYLYSFAVSAKMLNPAPQDYDPDSLNSYLNFVSNDAIDNISQNYTNSDVKPNIIAIMNESFADLSVLGDFDTNIDYMPFLRNMEENTIKGFTYVSVFGAGTCDSEYSFLTGNTTAYLPTNVRPYQQYIRSETPSLAKTLSQQGYTTEAIHPGDATAWNRNNVYPKMGFDKFISSSDFSTPTYTRGVWISDSSSYEHLINDYEQTNQTTNAPQFYFNVTIANHGSYDIQSNDLDPITITNHEGEFPQTEQYLSLIKKSDTAFQNLINYFSNQEEPTIILMFGDHQGQIDESFYDFVRGKPLNEWTIEELQQRYATPFVIWANYDIPEMTIDKLSVNYLAPLLLKTAGLDMTPYDQYLLNLAKDIPVINFIGFIDKNNHYYKKDEPSPYDEKLISYKQFLYNNIIDTNNRQTDLYTLTN